VCSRVVDDRCGKVGASASVIRALLVTVPTHRAGVLTGLTSVNGGIAIRCMAPCKWKVAHWGPCTQVIKDPGTLATKFLATQMDRNEGQGVQEFHAAPAFDGICAGG